MVAATTKAELIAVTGKEWAKLAALLQDMPPRHALRPDADGVSPRDIVAHRAHWSALFFQWLGEGAAAAVPDHGVKWSDLARYNAELRARHANLPWEGAVDWLTREHARFDDWLIGTDDAQLYGGLMPGGNGRWTTGRYAEAAGPSHYRSAAKYLRARIRSEHRAG